MRSSTSHGSTDWACPDSPDLKLSNRLVRTRMPGGVAGAQSIMTAPYPDSAPLVCEERLFYRVR